MQHKAERPQGFLLRSCTVAPRKRKKDKPSTWLCPLSVFTRSSGMRLVMVEVVERRRMVVITLLSVYSEKKTLSE